MIFDGLLHIVGQFLGYTWWLWAFVILWPLFRSTWRFWREEIYIHSDECRAILLELRVPRETMRSIQAMEQVLSGLNQMRNKPDNLQEWWIDGEVTKWFSFEMVSFGGEIHFYVRVPFYKQKSLVEAAFYAFYSDIELVEVPDYLDRLPSSVREMYSWGYNMWGTEMTLSNSDAYPTKSYKDFESPDEDKQYDPISQFIELLAKVEKEQIVAIQILLAPLGSDWADHFQHEVDKLRTAQSGGGHGGGGAFGKMNFPGGPLPASEHHDDKPQPFTFLIRTPGETDVLKAVETNLSKPAFETVIRFLYLSPEPTYFDSFPRRGLRGAFNQYAANDLNSFTQNPDVVTNIKIWDKPYIFPKYRNEYRKARLLYNYRGRKLPPETFMGKLITSKFFSWNFGTKPFHLTTAGIASLFHPPTVAVLVGPHMKRVTSHKVGPPAGLAIFSEEADFERFQQKK